MTSISRTAPIQITVCADLKEAYKSEVEKQFNINRYYKTGDWFGNSTNITGEDIFANVTYGLSELIDEKVQVRTVDHHWNFDPNGYHDDKFMAKVYSYNSTVPSPFIKFRKIYSGTCFSFEPPAFLWKDGVRRIRIQLQKEAFVRYSDFKLEQQLKKFKRNLGFLRGHVGSSECG